MYDAYDMMMRTGSKIKGRDKVERTGAGSGSGVDADGPGLIGSFGEPTRTGSRVEGRANVRSSLQAPTSSTQALYSRPLLAHQIARRFKVNSDSSSKELLHYVLLTSHRQAAVAC